jgi:hypothetical protein
VTFYLLTIFLKCRSYGALFKFFACGYKNVAPMGLQTGKIISENLQEQNTQ